MDSSPANSPVEGATSISKRKRVSRACDACFSKKDRCDGVRPICKVCKLIGRSCTYNRPERKRGPSQGVRQRLEGQVESLESVLGYMVDVYPQVCTDVIRTLRLDESENAMLSSLPPTSSLNTPSPSSTGANTSVNIYPQFSKQDARERWRVSSFAKALAPSLGLTLAGEDEDEDVYGMESMRHRIEEARSARARMRSGITESSPTMSSTSQNQQHQHQHQYHRPAPIHYPPPVPPPATSSILPLQYPNPTAPSHYPHYPQYQPAKERTYPTQSSISSNSSHPAPFTPEHTSHHSMPYHSQYNRPPDEYPSTPSIVPHLEPYDSYPSTSFEGETDALAYALGLTYSSSPQHNSTMNARTGSSTHPSTWMGPPTSISDSQGDIMHSIDQHMRSSAAADDNEDQHSAVLDFFAEHDLQPNQQQLSVLHQLGLQGSIDVPTPIDHSDRHEEVAGGTSSSSSSNNNLNNTNHWLQPIRGIN